MVIIRNVTIVMEFEVVMGDVVMVMGFGIVSDEW